MVIDQGEFLKNCFKRALEAADPQVILDKGLSEVFPQPLQGRCLVLGAGKAAASMAASLERYAKIHWPLAQIEGQVITRYQHALATKHIKVLEAGHPVPDAAGMTGAKEILALVKTLAPGDQLIALISGGGSSLLTLPAEGMSIDDLRITTQALLRCGAPIGKMNIVRKHLSAILGGHLGREAASRGATVHAFLISDVTGDDPSSIGSGPCATDPSTFNDAVEILKEYELWPAQLPTSVVRHLERGLLGEVPETPKDGDTIFKHVHNHVIGTAHRSLEAVAAYCHSVGIQPMVLGDTIMGEAKDIALMHAAIAREIAQYDQPFKKPVAILSGGECTVTIPQGIRGRGGRCSEFLLALFEATYDMPLLAALAADTDGIDGSENNAGAWFDRKVRQTCLDQKMDGKVYLARHDAYGFFESCGTLLHTGPTLTNVNDLRVILIDGE